jgi:lantibiotic modifying enzyme
MENVLEISLKSHLKLLENYYLKPYRDKQLFTFGVMSGLSGTILLQVLLFRSTKNKKFLPEIEKNIKCLINNIESGVITSTFFCNGLAGIGWLFYYLKDEEILEIDIDFFLEDLDDVLVNGLEKMIADDNFDILHGALGIGLYFLKRRKINQVEKLIYILSRTAENFGDNIAWKRFDKYGLNKNIYDFGLAHGNISTIYFLGKCYSQNILQDTCLELITKGLNFYFSNLQKPEEYGSYFPGKKDCEIYKNNCCYGEYSRLGWCYGDLGILHTILVVSRWTQNDLMAERTISLLKESTKRRERNQTSIIDPCFCHGSSGVGYLYLNLYNITRDKIFLNAAKFWAKKTLSFNKGSKVLNYHFYSEELGWQQNIDILTGMGGTTLFYLAFCDRSRKNNINELFFLE